MISLVGYTNAGKSTLFNTLTESEVYAADKLFATLDPTLRRLEVDHLGPVVMADTVGFIAQLPHTLVDAFKATLEETLNADLLLHVIDVAAEDRGRLIRDVETVLEDIGASDVPQLRIFNKIDLLEQSARIVRDESGMPIAVYVSALGGLGMDLLQQALRERLQEGMFDEHVVLQPAVGKLRAGLYEQAAAVDEQYLDDGSSQIHVRMPLKDWYRLKS